MAGVPDVTRMATVCAALRIDADVVPAAGVGSVVVLGPEADPATAVQILSRFLRRADVLLLVRSQGQVQAERWRGGVLHDSPAPGLLLAGLPSAVEDLLLSNAPASELDGAVSSVGLHVGGGPLRAAMLWLSRLLARPARRPS